MEKRREVWLGKPDLILGAAPEAGFRALSDPTSQDQLR
jgi:hypothetical protein